MPRTDPSRSFETAARHLFRNLNDPSALRSNPLASGFFTGTAGNLDDDLNAVKALRAAIARGALSLLRIDDATGQRQRGERQYAIVVRCDLEGRPHDGVARELGLSIRQFYRERKAACRRIGESLRSTNEKAHSTNVFDRGEAGLAQAKLLDDFGRLHGAQAVLAEIASISADPSVRVAAASAQIGMLAEQEDFERAGDILRAVRGDLEDLGAPRANEAQIAGATLVELAAAKLAFFSGAMNAARAHVGAADAALKEAQASSAPLADLAVEAALARARVQGHFGEFEAAFVSAEGARTALAHIRLPTPLQAVDVASTLAEAAQGTRRASAMRRIATTLDDALAIGKRHGLVGRTAAVLSTMLETRHGPARNREIGAQLLATAASHGAPLLIAGAHLHVASVELLFGAPLDAQAHLHQALPQFVAGSLYWLGAKITEARIALALGDLSAADSALSAAQSVADRSGSPRMRGAILSERALLQSLRSKQREAHASISASLALLERYGRSDGLALAHRIAERLEGPILPTIPANVYRPQ